jgi:lysozyme
MSGKTWRDLARDLICKFEGCKLSAYQDQGGKWTCGYGSTGPDVGPSTVWTQAEADARFLSFLETVHQEVCNLVKAPLTEAQMAAVVCFTYNVGAGNLAQSTLLRCINTFHMQDAANEFLRWDKCKGVFNQGLLNRRKAESILFLDEEA